MNQLSMSPTNTVFALVRKLSSASKLEQLNRSNIRILEADITDVQALKVTFYDCIRSLTDLNIVGGCEGRRNNRRQP